MSRYAARIRAARGYADITQQQLADRMGVDVQWVKRREKNSGGQNPKPGELIAIAAICEVPEQFMTSGFGEPSRSELVEILDEISERLELLSPSDEALERELGDAADEADRRESDSERDARERPGRGQQ